jgi:hypothetical protein
MAKASLTPQHLHGKMADCFLIVEQASRWQMSPFAVAQCTSCIQGKLMYEGKLVAAVINARGDLEHRLDYEYSGEGQGRTVRVHGRVRGEAADREVSVKLADAATNNTLWKKQPDQQLMYHGARVWARRHMPELMLGVYSPEEMEPRNETIPTSAREQPALEAPSDPFAITIDLANAILARNPSRDELERLGKTLHEATRKRSNKGLDKDPRFLSMKDEYTKQWKATKTKAAAEVTKEIVDGECSPEREPGADDGDDVSW